MIKDWINRKFGKKTESESTIKDKNFDIDYDKNASFYHSNLINSIILFSLTKSDLEKLISPTFNPFFELETEIDYAFMPVCFETVFRNGLINSSFRSELLEFKLLTHGIPSEIWDWEYIDIHPTWIQIRQKAINILDKLEVKNRIYSDDYIIHEK
ncbi:hypothetical protein [Solitalea canadensis]|uniref:Uncharacterized protein n=1 Tax=Solitalea canadensis (strain ATCC 29591 / DSM 3403 / JCM 21819 / LMG 8368 / NBRC 15130 / NCIMB 12057 / USAM 9D) TaxID=929556 RepID=H8KVY6_SOLCM|nr:hypothetical protein [Solitalea canadensis]AFD06889.1 hypothetical protein Solca_1828 [Solitalea canadensis DSM 3403]